jgi:hypothetical protein
MLGIRESACASSRSNASYDEAAVMARAPTRLVICLDNSGYEVSLERRKIYVALPDAAAAKHRQIRVIDE